MLELKYAVTNFKIYWIFLAQETNTKSTFAPLDGTQSKLPDTIYRIFCGKIINILVWCERMSHDENPIEIPIFHHISDCLVYIEILDISGK